MHFKQALASVRDRATRLVFRCRTQRAHPPTSTNSEIQRPCSIGPSSQPIPHQDAAIALASSPTSHTADAYQGAAPIPLTTIRKVPATLAVTTEAAHVCKFSHGTSLLVYVNGALISAACAALKVNIATLEFVKRLPLNELGAVGGCLGAAFADTASVVDITWAEVGSETEQHWREAEQHWEAFPGGPYTALELQDYDKNSFMWRSIRRMASNDSSATSSGIPIRSVMAEIVPNALPDYPDSFSYASTCFHDRDTVESTTSQSSKAPFDVFSEGFSDKENIRTVWSPGKGDSPIMSSEEFDALPHWSGAEDEIAWNSSAEEMLELDEFF